MFHLLKSLKRQKGPLGQSISTNFVADCSYIVVEVVLYCMLPFRSVRCAT